MNFKFLRTLIVLALLAIVPNSVLADDNSKDQKASVLPPRAEALTVANSETLESLIDKAETFVSSVDELKSSKGVNFTRARAIHLRSALRARCEENAAQVDDEERIRERCGDARRKIDEAVNSLPQQ